MRGTWRQGRLALWGAVLATACACTAGNQVPRRGSGSSHSASEVHTCPEVRQKPGRERRLTRADERAFTGPEVRAYVAALRQIQFPDAVVMAPHEFDAVVDADKRAVPFLLRLSSGNDEDMRWASLHALEQITNRSFGNLLPMDKQEPTPQEWKQTARGYQQWWERHRDSTREDWLIEDTSSADLVQRRSAVTQLGDYDMPSVREALVRSLSDPDRSVQVEAAVSLARLGDRRAVPVLVHMLLPDGNSSVRKDGICWLKSLTGLTFGFDPGAPAASRAKALLKWNHWLQESYHPGTAPGTR